MVSPRHLLLAAILLTASTISARAVDEIQVYNAEIAKVGQWTFQLHNMPSWAARSLISPAASSPIMPSTGPGNGPGASRIGGRWASTRRMPSTRS